MSVFVKAFAKHSCPVCGGKLKRNPIELGESFIFEVIFWLLYGAAFLVVGFFGQGLGGSSLLASCISLALVSLIAIPIRFRQSSYRCASCDKNYDFSEVKSHVWFKT